MKYINNPFPHEDGAPASLQDSLDEKALLQQQKQSQKTAQEYMKMLISTMK